MLASAYPGDKDVDIHKNKLRIYINAGVQVVVNTMTTREAKRMPQYQDIMLEYAKEGIFLFD